MMKNDDKPWGLSLSIIILYHHLPYVKSWSFFMASLEATGGARQGGDWPLSQVFLAAALMDLQQLGCQHLILVGG